MERRALDPPLLRIDLRQTRCATLLSYAGIYQLTLDSTVAELGIELHSTYLGQRLAGFVATIHLAVVRGQPPRVFCAPSDGPGDRAGDRRRDCLIHHLDQLSVLVADRTGGAVRIDITEAALAATDDASISPEPPSTPAKDRGSAGH